jgi:hypothetical protein
METVWPVPVIPAFEIPESVNLTENTEVHETLNTECILMLLYFERRT